MPHLLPVTPNAETMLAHLEHLFGDYMGEGLCEIASTDRAYPHQLRHGEQHAASAYDEIAERASRLSAETNINVYITGGVRRPGTIGRAQDAAVSHCVAFWADFDKPGDAESAHQACQRLGIPPTWITTTGTLPHVRQQFWWALETPLDAAPWAQIEARLVALLNGDQTIRNPSRVMRLAGSVAWPLKQGRTLELTTGEATGVPRYAAETIASALDRASPVAKTSASILDFNTAQRQQTPDLDFAKTYEAGTWHEGARDMVARMVSEGSSDDTILALAPSFKRDGYTLAQTRHELRVFIDGARRKGFAPEVVQAPQPDAKPRFSFLDMDDLDNMEPPEWLIQGLISERGFSVLYGPPGAGKSFIALDMALSAAYGMAYRDGRACKEVPVVYVAGEGQHGMGVRVQAWRKHRGNGAKAKFFRLLPSAPNLTDKGDAAELIKALSTLSEQPKLIVIDTLARSFGGKDENSTPDMNLFVSAIDAIREATGAHVMVIHHSGKDKEKGARGSTVLRGAVDTEILCDRTEHTDNLTLKNTKQKDAEEAKPIKLRLVTVEITNPKTGEIATSKLPVLDDDASVNLSSSGAHGKNERKILAMLERGPARFVEMKAQLGVNPGSLTRSLRTLLDQKVIEKDDNGVFSLDAIGCILESEE